MSTLDQFYLQDSRSTCGNDMMFWSSKGGYTTDIVLAAVFTQATAMAQHRTRETDIPWPKAYIDERVRPAVDFQRCNRTEDRHHHRTGEIVKRAVTERDLRMPEFRDADVADLEFRGDGALVRKDRWESGMRKIANAVGLPMHGDVEIHQVVDEVVEMAEGIQQLAAEEIWKDMTSTTRRAP